MTTKKERILLRIEKHELNIKKSSMFIDELESLKWLQRLDKYRKNNEIEQINLYYKKLALTKDHLNKLYSWLREDCKLLYELNRNGGI